MIPSLPWLFAGAAVAYLVWQARSASPAAIPSLSPSPLPSLPAAPAGGVSPLLLAAIIVPWGLLAVSQFANHEQPQPPPAPAPNGWPTIDLRGSFVGPDAVADALTTERLLHWLADTIATDRATGAPRLTTGAAFDDLRRTARDFRMHGVTLGARQPLAKDRIAAFLDATVGTDGGPVDDAGAEKWQRALNDASKAAGIAARGQR